MRVVRASGCFTVAALLAMSLASCSSTDGTATPAPSTRVVTVTASPSASPGSATPSTTTATSSAYTATTARITGANQRATWDVTIPQLSGGTPAVTAEFNQSMRAALQDQIDAQYDPHSGFTLSNGYSKGPFHIGQRVISAEQITGWIANPPGAHGDSLISTVTIDADNAKPITLQDAFGNLDAGLQRLSSEAAKILPTTNAGPSYVREGMAPTLTNYANWTASPDGMRIHFGDYQVGAYAAGLITITVPWSALSDVLAPGMQDVLSS